jgi:hypothetical protein
VGHFQTVAATIRIGELPAFGYSSSMTAIQNSFFLDDDDPSDERLEDLHVGSKSLAQAVVYNTDWTVETITGQVAKGAIDLTPSFQRRDAWSAPKKSLLIESVLLNFPIPPLTLAEMGASKTYVVVDGKQRLNTLSQFFGLMEDSRYNNFRLSGLQELDGLNGANIEDLRNDYPGYYRALENYSIRTNVIRGWQRDDVLYSIFLRLNSGSVKLSPQELRQALNPGGFSDWLADYTVRSPALRSIFAGPEPDFRMRDMELMIRHLAMKFFLESYRGDLKRFLDGAAKTFNADWERWRTEVDQSAELFEKAYTAVVEVFGESQALRKWNGDRWENRLNRAVFDTVFYYLSDMERISRFKEHGPNLVKEFQALCENDQNFRDGIETTTKSLESVEARLGRWGEVLYRYGIVGQVVALSADRVLVNHVPS